MDEPPVITRVPDANVAPEFASATTSRTVAENTAAGEGIGNPVAADDANGDALTYALRGTDTASFAIDSDTGQLMTLAALDYETKATYSVTVTASDPGGLSDSIDVTITVTDVDEAPVITGDAAQNYAENGTAVVGTYTADGPVAASWSLEGDDMGAFTIGGSSGELVFASPPDFEAPADMGMDNMYQVTVKAEAGGETDMIDVTVTVTNVEEPGMVTLWAGSDALTMAPQVGDTITGAVMDPDNPDDDATVESWQWARTMDDMDGRDMDSWMPISGETNATYTVTEGDTGYYLRVMAMYTDAVGTDTAMVYSMPTMMVGAEAGDTLLVKYDDDNDGWIQLDEARDAVGDYFDPPKGSELSLDDTRKVVGLYFLYKNRQQ